MQHHRQLPLPLSRELCLLIFRLLPLFTDALRQRWKRFTAKPSSLNQSVNLITDFLLAYPVREFHQSSKFLGELSKLLRGRLEHAAVAIGITHRDGISVRWNLTNQLQSVAFVIKEVCSSHVENQITELWETGSD